MTAATIALPQGWIAPKRAIAASGVRGGGSEFQLVCGVGTYELDLLVRDFHEVFELMGQVTEGESIYAPVRGLPVQLVDADGNPIGELGSTNEFGEFESKADERGLIGLRLGTGEDAPCVLVRGESQ